MNYEQKYKDTLERAKTLYKNSKGLMHKRWVKQVFPELQEIEDERIKYEIKVILTNTDFSQFALDYNYADMIAWLEKQSEKSNPYSGISFEHNGHTWGMCARDNGVDILLDKQLFKHLENQNTEDCTAVDPIPAMEEQCVPLATSVCEHPLPELEEESEDERIRKELIEHIKTNRESGFILFQKISPDEVIAWLEKQGEQKLFNNDKYQTVSVKILDRLYESEKELERLKQGEQKLAKWSEEDEKILEILINDTEKTLFAIKQEERPDIMSGLSEIYIERLRWFKSLKKRLKG